MSKRLVYTTIAAVAFPLGLALLMGVIYGAAILLGKTEGLAVLLGIAVLSVAVLWATMTWNYPFWKEESKRGWPKQ